jgi:hypothetical protein
MSCIDHTVLLWRQHSNKLKNLNKTANRHTSTATVNANAATGHNLCLIT